MMGLALLLALAAIPLGHTLASNAALAQDEKKFVKSNLIYSGALSATWPICTYYFGFNAAKAPFGNALVRKAFIAAVDRQSLASALGSSVLPAMTFTPPGMFGHVDGFSEGVGIPYSPPLARQWLTDAGYPNGQGLPQIKAAFATGLTGFYTTTVSAQFAQFNWSHNLSATVALQSMEASAFLLALQTDPPQIWYIRWCTDQPDTHEAYYFLYDGVNARRIAFGNWQNTTYDNLLSQALGTSDLTARKLLYKQAEKILVETDAVMLPMHYSDALRQRIFLPMVLK